MTTHILALEKDIFFAVRIRETLLHYDIEATTVRRLSAFEQLLAAPAGELPALVIVNTAATGIDWESAIRQARAHGLPVLAFGSHKDLEARERAIKAGAQRVVANSKFTTDMPGLVQRMLSESDALSPGDPA
jgi:DNA-binding response OmpR family regulator